MFLDFRWHRFFYRQSMVKEGKKVRRINQGVAKTFLSINDQAQNLAFLAFLALYFPRSWKYII